MSIQELGGRIKGVLDTHGKEWGIPIVVILVGLASFGLGRLSALQGAETVISVAAGEHQAASTALTVGGLVVASKTGSSYHYPWCAGATTIKESNKVWFKNEEAAKAAGYKPAKNCKGLK